MHSSYTSTNTNIQSRRRWLFAGLILFISLGFIYTAFHHHHDFSFHPDCPVCNLAGQAPAITPPADILLPDRTPQPFFHSPLTLPGDQSFPTASLPRAPPA
jgi:hypothetical protein